MLNELNVKIGNRIRNLRHEQGLSLHELSLKTGELSKSRISNYEQGLRRPSIEVARILGEALGVSPTYLLLLDENSPSFTKNELALIDHYRQADPRGQAEILKVAGLELHGIDDSDHHNVVPAKQPLEYRKAA